MSGGSTSNRLPVSWVVVYRSFAETDWGGGAVRSRSAGTARQSSRVQDGVDDEDPQAVRAEGYDPDDPAVVAAIDLVRWELSLKPMTEG